MTTNNVPDERDAPDGRGLRDERDGRGAGEGRDGLPPHSGGAAPEGAAGLPEPAAPRRRLGMPGRPRPGEYLETVLRDPAPGPDQEPEAAAPAAVLPGYPLSTPSPLPPEPEPAPPPAPAAQPVREPVAQPEAALLPAARPASAPEHAAPPEAAPAQPVPAQPVPAAGEGDDVARVPLKAALEAILMIVDEPATVAHLAEVLARPKRAVASALRELAEEYTAQGRGFDLRFVAGGWRFYSRASCAPAVDRYVLDGQHARLTQAALETLAVIAYRQPVSRSRVSAVRGVNCDGVMRTLVQRGLVEETGSEPETGAILYRTTQQFLERMGLRGLDELPELAPFLPEADEVEPDSQEGSAIAEAVAAQS